MNNQQTLLEAIEGGNLAEVQRLVDARDVDLNPRAGDYKTHPLLLASYVGHEDIVRFLVECGADVNQNGETGWTALMFAVNNNHADVALLLLQQGAQVNARAKSGRTALHIAAYLGYVDLLRVLLDHGADRTLKDKNGQTAEDFAREKRERAAFDFLRNYVPVTPVSPDVSSPAPPPASVAPPSISGQTDELASLRAQLQATTDELAAARAQHVTLRQELEATREEVTASRHEVESSHQRAMAATQRAVATEQELSRALRELRAANATIGELRLSRDQLRVELVDYHAADPIIPAAELQLSDRMLGHGALGEVRAAAWLGTRVAVKRLFALGGGGGGANNGINAAAGSGSAYGTLTAEERAGVLSTVRREIDALARLRCPYLVQFYGYSVNGEGDLDCIVMEQLAPVSLAAAAASARHVLLCVSRALQYLHGRRIIHRDVKLSNVLFDAEKNVYKLSDLGESKVLDRMTARQTSGRRGTPVYMAPEIKISVEGDEPTSGADVFSFGVLALEVSTGVGPNPMGPEMRRVPGQRHTEPVPEVERRAGDLGRLAEGAPVKAMVIRCLAMNPEERPSAKECAEHFDAA